MYVRTYVRTYVYVYIYINIYVYTHARGPGRRVVAAPLFDFIILFVLASSFILVLSCVYDVVSHYV